MGGHVNTIRYLAPKLESLLHSSDNGGKTMIHWAAQYGHADVVRLVIDQFDLDPTVCDKVSAWTVGVL